MVAQVLIPSIMHPINFVTISQGSHLAAIATAFLPPLVVLVGFIATVRLIVPVTLIVYVSIVVHVTKRLAVILRSGARAERPVVPSLAGEGEVPVIASLLDPRLRTDRREGDLILYFIEDEERDAPFA